MPMTAGRRATGFGKAIANALREQAKRGTPMTVGSCSTFIARYEVLYQPLGDLVIVSKGKEIARSPSDSGAVKAFMADDSSLAPESVGPIMSIVNTLKEQARQNPDIKVLVGFDGSYDPSGELVITHNGRVIFRDRSDSDAVKELLADAPDAHSADRFTCHLDAGPGVPVVPTTDAAFDYLEEHPFDLMDAVRAVAASVYEEFKNDNATLTLELYRDPEFDDERLTLYVRLPKYAPDTLDRIRAAAWKHDDLFDRVDGALLATTDFKPPVVPAPEVIVRAVRPA